MPPPFNPRCSPKRVIMKMIYAAGAGRKRRSETVLIRRHLRKGSGGVRREVLTGAKLLLGYSGGGGGGQTGSHPARRTHFTLVCRFKLHHNQYSILEKKKNPHIIIHLF